MIKTLCLIQNFYIFQHKFFSYYRLQGNILRLFVILFTGGSASVHAGIPPPPPPPGTRYTTPLPGTRHPPGPGTHPHRDQAHYPLPPCTPQDQGDTCNARAVRILLECNLVNEYISKHLEQCSFLQDVHY